MDTIHIVVYYKADNTFALHINGKASEHKFGSIADLREKMVLGTDPIVVIGTDGKYLYTSKWEDGIETVIASMEPIF